MFLVAGLGRGGEGDKNHGCCMILSITASTSKMIVNKVFIYALLAISANALNESNNIICTVPAIIDNASLENWADYFQQETCELIQLLGKNYTLQKNLNFSDKNNLAFLGVSLMTTLQCTGGTGITFTNMTNLTIGNIIFMECGRIHPAQKLNFKAAILISESTVLSISNAEFVKSDGTGLAMLNVAGAIKISNSIFKNGKVSSTHDHASGGGGVYLELGLPCNQTEEENADSKQICEPAEYHFNNCKFIDNNATATNNSLNCDDGLFTGVGHGGAMSLRLQNYPSYVEVTVSDSTFSSNSAEWGGAIELVACRATNNHIAFTNSRVIGNNGSSKGGGGLDIEFSGLGTKNNSIFVLNTIFEENDALYGGGVSISTHYAYDQSNNSVNFENCSWVGNCAHYASAVDIFPAGVLDGWHTKPEVSFNDCTFESNYRRDEHIAGNIYRLGEGVVMVTGFTVTFRGQTTFLNNTGSSIYAISSLLKFDSDVTALFQSNIAEVGAGIVLVGFSVIAVGNGSCITFLNNTVSKKGAAIYYYSTDKHIYVHKQRCFIQKLDESVSGASFNFIGNRAPKEPFYGNENYITSAIYTSTNLAACCQNATSCDFGGVGEFIFSSSSEFSEPESCNSTDLVSDISNYSQYYIITGERDFTFDLGDGKKVNATPGFLTKVPLIGSKNTTFDVTIEKSNESRITVVHSHYSIHNNRLILEGESGETATLIFTEQSNRKYYLKFEVEIDHCPPLFKLSPRLHCTCYSTDDTYYVASFRCESNFRSVSLHVGYWVGYADTLHESNQTLYISYCPNSYCYSNKSLQDDYYYKLPRDPIKLEGAVCSSNRRGILCGQCKENTTVYFYTRSFKCGGTANCAWGPFLYLLSEILPLTLLFLAVILFNISFTSGDLNGFIFFAQMYDTVSDVVQGFIVHDKNLERARIIPQLIYRFFNLDYFGIDEMSFCLWENADTLSILAFKYLTVVYALVLVLGTVLTIRICSTCRFVRLRKMRYSVIQGLSAFLVMAYSQCTEISFSILNPINIYNGTKRASTVVFLQGSVGYFSREHLPFALPALLCVLSFVAVVPLLLISYPLCNKIIAFFDLEDKPVIKFASQLFPMYRIKPFLDCFQGTFKDDYRFFAGLYFAYRAAILACRFAPTVLIIYAMMELQLITMLILHTLSWPYQRKIHNVIDALLIANLAIITLLKMLVQIQAEMTKLHSSIFVTYAVELVFVNIPLIALIIFAACKIFRRVKSWLKGKEEHKRDTKILDELFLEDNVRDMSLNTSTDSYILMRERQLEKLNNY